MAKRKTFITLILVLVLAITAGILDYPKYFNQGVDSTNSFLGSKNLGVLSDIKFPHFPNVPFRLGLDLQGGSHLIYQADLSQIEQANQGDAMSGLRDVIERRVNLFGVAEPIVQVQKDRLIVELAGIKDINQAIQMIGQTPYLEFREPRTQEETQKILDKKSELQGLTTMEEIQKVPDWQLALEDPNFKATNLTGQYLKSAQLSFDQTSSKPLVSIEFNDEGAKLFEELTTKNVGKQLAIYIDDALISAPVVEEAISLGKAQISGNFTLDTAKELARNLNAGALPVPITLISQQTVGPTLGKLSLDQSLKAGFLGLLAIIIFMVVIYRLPGLLASIALAIYVALLLGIFKLIPVTLTLSGIAGFILSIGMAVDANILIFARMKEELRAGNSFGSAVENGFKRAWPSIRDSNFNSLIVCFILFTFATSFIKGFALTLSLGVLVSIFSAVFITRILLLMFVGTKLEKFKWLW